MRKIIAIFVSLITLNTVNAQTFKLDSDGRDQGYVNTILGRSKR